MENWIEVYEFDKEAEESIKWLFELLDEEKIPHKEEWVEKWIGSKIYKLKKFFQKNATKTKKMVTYKWRVFLQKKVLIETFKKSFKDLTIINI